MGITCEFGRSLKKSSSSACSTRQRTQFHCVRPEHITRSWLSLSLFGTTLSWIVTLYCMSIVDFVQCACLNWNLALFHCSVLIDDGTPRLPLSFRIQLSLSVLRFKQMIEAQEGFGVSEQELFFQGNQVITLSRFALLHKPNKRALSKQTKECV